MPSSKTWLKSLRWNFFVLTQYSVGMYVDGKESAALESLNQKPSFVHLLVGFLGTLT